MDGGEAGPAPGGEAEPSPGSEAEPSPRADARPTLLLQARAKLNLGLEVLGRRPDGYHEIRSIVQSILLADEIEIRPRRDGRLLLSCPGSDLPEDEGNLALRAARLLRDRHARPKSGASLVLRKQIPVGAGLGGGSSDAAAVLVGLSRLWGLRLPLSRLEALASEIGSDVPFFIRGGTQRMEGRGETLHRLPAAAPLPVLVIHPTLFISTASIYSAGNFALTAERPLPTLRVCDLTTLSGAYRCLRGLRNDLEPVVTARHERVARLLEELRAFHPAVVRVTGSGSSVFVMDEDVRLLRRILREASVGDCRVFATRFARRGLVSVVPRTAEGGI